MTIAGVVLFVVGAVLVLAAVVDYVQENNVPKLVMVGLVGIAVILCSFWLLDISEGSDYD